MLDLTLQIPEVLDLTFKMFDLTLSTLDISLEMLDFILLSYI